MNKRMQRAPDELVNTFNADDCFPRGALATNP